MSGYALTRYPTYEDGKLAGHKLINQAFHSRIVAAPVVHDGANAARLLGELERRCADEQELAPLKALLATEPVRNLLAGVFGASPYLTSLIERDPARLMRMLSDAPEEHFAELCRTLEAAVAGTTALPEVMRALRQFKNAVALLTALADLAGIWPVMTVTRRLSEAADAAVGAAVRFLFRHRPHRLL